MNVIDKILNEWSFRCHDGIVDMNDPTKVSILNEILDEYGVDEAGRGRPPKPAPPEDTYEIGQNYSKYLRIKEVGVYYRGKKNGIFRYFDLDGNFVSECYYVNDNITHNTTHNTDDNGPKC
jgi:hypothetical protein